LFLRLSFNPNSENFSEAFTTHQAIVQPFFDSFRLKDYIFIKSYFLFLTGKKKHCGYNNKVTFKKLPEHFGGNSVVIQHTDRYSFLTTPGRGGLVIG